MAFNMLSAPLFAELLLFCCLKQYFDMLFEKRLCIRFCVEAIIIFLSKQVALQALFAVLVVQLHGANLQLIQDACSQTTRTEAANTPEATYEFVESYADELQV